MAERVTMEINTEGRVIKVRSVNIWSVTLFLVIWVTAWSYGGYEAILRLYDSIVNFQPGQIPIIVFFSIWLLGWAAGELLVAAIILWFFFGTEIITVSQGELIISYDIKFFKYRKKYNVNEINDIRQEKQAFVFTYRGKRVMLGLMLKEPEAAMLLTYLRQCLPQGRFA